MIETWDHVPSDRDHDFLIGGGAMGELIRSKDWSVTPLGSIESWPQSLRTTVSLCLSSNFPIDLIWGPEHIQIYNDGYKPICAGKHPRSLGENFTKTWASAWSILDEAFTGALAGRTSFLENQRTFLDRNGYLEETFFTFSLSPIRDESGNVGGLFHPVIETTAQMLSERRTRALQDLASHPSQSKSLKECCELSAEALGKFQLDLPFALIYLVNDEGTQAHLSTAAHLPWAVRASPLTIDLCHDEDSTWPLQEAMRTRATARIDGLTQRFGPIESGPYDESPETAFVLPLILSGIDHPAAFLIVAISPRLPLTPEYRAFIDLLASTLTASLLNAHAYQEERKRAEKLAELDTAKTVFFSNISHEFRTPLTLMVGPLDEMLSHSGDRVTATRDSVELVHRNSLRLLRLVNTLLDFSRIEAGRAHALFQPVNLAAFTKDLASSFRSVVEKAGLVFDVVCADLSEQIYIDREMWEKIVLNLLSNAFKFTFEGKISLTLSDMGDAVELSVNDTGGGIPSHELPNLFMRFHRVQGARGRSHEGTGIGLALVDSLVKLHGGSLRVESEVGKGSTFFVRIPKGSHHLPAEQVKHKPDLAIDNKAAVSVIEEVARWLPDATFTNQQNSLPISPLATASHGKSGRVLLADDNADMRQYIQNILSSEFEVEAVANGALALAAIKERTPDLVLTDVMMPALDGFGLLKELRGNRQTKAIPVVMLSARAGEESRIEGLQSGADDYLVKPFHARELLARVRSNLELSRLRADLSREDERRLAAAEMERQWRLFDTALSHTPDSLYIFDRNLRFIYANSALLQRWGKSLENILGKTLSEIGYPPALTARIEEQFHQVLRDGVAVRDNALVPDIAGQERYYDYIFVPIFGADHEIEAVAGSSRDVTALMEEVKKRTVALKELQAKERELQHSLADQTTLLKEVHHRVKNNLQVISSLLRMQGEMLKDPGAAAALKESQHRVASMSLVHEQLYGDKALGQIDFASFSRTLVGALLQSYGASVSGIICRFDVSPVYLTADQAVPCGLILNELVTNALKYAYPNNAPGEIVISLNQTADGSVVMGVSDSGVGLPPDLNLNDIPSLGLTLVASLTDQLQGELTIKSQPGADFKVTFKQVSRTLSAKSAG